MRYSLSGLLAVAVCAVLAGASSFAAITDWLHDLDEQARDRLGFDHGVPVGTTVWRLLTRLDDGLLSTVLAGWLTARARPVTTARPRRYRTVIALDGKRFGVPAVPAAARSIYSPRWTPAPASSWPRSP
ncbi:transposase family protein [Micromonospora sp. NPDC049004]|uniref:transposase family protein n=1 Tax=Micromonospora sp. NPDC049004 TaxID=3154348 RepID=UPI0033D6871E